MAQPETKRSVGRPREFDEEAALEAAMDAFWQKGYEATSLTDLCTCTGLHKGSLYQAFGDKHSLFMRSLHHYADREFKDTAVVAYQFESPLDSIRAIVRTVCDHAAEGRGCLMINSMVELAPHDPEVKQAIENEGQKRIRVFTELLTRARDKGEIRADLVPEKLAQQLLIGLAGAAAMVKGLVTTEQVMEILDDMIGYWT
ncbi:MAG: TetR/AcrR family transcriptional regulator [Woeseiaceae bacterium]|nr:TetR/AcrR family transcriptional regulator [Woeseiaceae bacterium]